VGAYHFALPFDWIGTNGSRALSTRAAPPQRMQAPGPRRDPPRPSIEAWFFYVKEPGREPNDAAAKA